MSMPEKESRFARTGMRVPSKPLPINRIATLAIRVETESNDCFNDIQTPRRSVGGD
jgi:hypothetical protein